MRHPIEMLVVHHSASPNTTTAKRIAAWHAGRFKFGIGYHRIIEHDGSVLDGRKVQRVGAHAHGSNTNSIGVCVAGDNTKRASKWTPAQHDSLAIIIKYYRMLYPSIWILGHRDTQGASTVCPGLDIATWCLNRGIEPSTTGENHA